MSDLKAKMHQNRFRLGLRPRPRWGRGAYSVPPDPLAVFKGPTSKGKEGKGKRGGKGKGKGKGRGWEGEGKGGGERPYTPLVANSWLRHCLFQTSSKDPLLSVSLSCPLVPIPNAS